MDKCEVPKSIAGIAQSAVNGRIGVIEAARLLAPMLHAHPHLVTPDDFNAIVGVDSETDDLPVGWVRQEWDTEALAEKDLEINRCEGLWKDQVLAVCRRILDKADDLVDQR